MTPPNPYPPPACQVNVADVVVGHKADLADEDQLAAFRAWAAELFPPKLQVWATGPGCPPCPALPCPALPCPALPYINN